MASSIYKSADSVNPKMNCSISICRNYFPLHLGPRERLLYEAFLQCLYLLFKHKHPISHFLISNPFF